MCEADLSYLSNVKKLLQGFQAVSGLKVNYKKTGLLVFGKDDVWWQEAINLLGCSLIELPLPWLSVRSFNEACQFLEPHNTENPA